jgi:hypothetical protein
MIRRLVCLVSALFLGFAWSSANAFVIDMHANLGGNQEVPSNASTGKALAAFTFDLDTFVLAWNITSSGLTGPITAAHFHGPAFPGNNATVKIDIGAISGLGSSMTGAVDFDGNPFVIGDGFDFVSGSDNAFVNALELLGGLWYVNLHTSQFPGGEVRGQVRQGQLVPEPGMLALLGLALATMAITLRRQRVRL